MERGLTWHAGRDWAVPRFGEAESVRRSVPNAAVAGDDGRPKLSVLHHRRWRASKESRRPVQRQQQRRSWTLSEPSLKQQDARLGRGHAGVVEAEPAIEGLGGRH